MYVAWSRRNRSALVRVPLYHPGSEKATRMELRCPDPACNPYLTFAVLLQAGLEGIEKGYELPEPMEKNLYHLSGEERRRLGVEQLPESLGRGDRDHRRVRARAAHARRAHVQPLRRDQAPGVGRLPRAGHPAGSSTATWRSCRRSIAKAYALPAPAGGAGLDPRDGAGDRPRRGRGASAAPAAGARRRVGCAGRDLGHRRSTESAWLLVALLAAELAEAQQAERGARGAGGDRGVLEVLAPRDQRLRRRTAVEKKPPRSGSAKRAISSSASAVAST